MPRLETKEGEGRCGFYIASACFCKGNKRGLIHLIPSCHCGTGCMYCQAGCRSNSCRVRKSFFPLFAPPPPSFSRFLSLSLSLPPSSTLSDFFLILPPLFPLSNLYKHALQSFGWGMFRYAFTHTHTHILSACRWCCRLGNNESQKETFLQEDLELQHCK